MNRRTFLLGAGTTTIGGTALLGSGAFTRAQSQRRMKIDVADDWDAYLGLDGCPHSPNSSYTQFDEDGHLAIEMSDENPTDAGGIGVNSNSRTYFDDVFQICNNGKQPISVWISDDGRWPMYNDERRVEFYTGRSKGADSLDQLDSIIGTPNQRLLQTGECLCVGIATVTKDLGSTDQLLSDIDDEIVIYGDSDRKLAKGPVTNQDRRKTYKTLQKAIDKAGKKDTIKVFENQSKSITIDKPLTVVGIDDPLLADGVNIEADHVRLSGFRIEAFNQAQGVVIDGSHVEVSNNYIESVAENVITADTDGGYQGITVRDNELHVTGSDTQQVHIHGGLEDNELTNPSRNVDIVANRFTADDLGDGVSLRLETDAGRFTRNRFDDPETDLGHVQLFGPNHEVADNEFLGESLSGGAFYLADSLSQYDLDYVLNLNDFDPSAVVVDNELRPE